MATPSVLHAETHHLDSIEWQALRSEAIVIGTVTNVKSSDKELDDSKSYNAVNPMDESVTIKIMDTLKGNLKGTVTIERRTTQLASAARWERNGHEMLFFLSKGSKAAFDTFGVRYSPTSKYEPQMDGKLTIIDRFFDVVDLSHWDVFAWPVFNHKGVMLTQKDDMLSAVRGVLTWGKTSSYEIPLDLPSIKKPYPAGILQTWEKQQDKVLLRVPQ